MDYFAVKSTTMESDKYLRAHARTIEFT